MRELGGQRPSSNTMIKITMNKEVITLDRGPWMTGICSLDVYEKTPRHLHERSYRY